MQTCTHTYEPVAVLPHADIHAPCTCWGPVYPHLHVNPHPHAWVHTQTPAQRGVAVSAA